MKIRQKRKMITERKETNLGLQLSQLYDLEYSRQQNREGKPRQSLEGFLT